MLFMVAVGDISVNILTQVGQIGLWLKAAGIIFILWIIFQVIIVIINARRMKEIYKIKEDMKRMEAKLDKILKK